jgi:hypothetical protein
MPDNYPPADHAEVRITKPESTELIDAQCVRVKLEISRLQAMLEAHPHDEQRNDALTFFTNAHDAFQALQTFINYR